MTVGRGPVAWSNVEAAVEAVAGVRPGSAIATQGDGDDIVVVCGAARPRLARERATLEVEIRRSIAPFVAGRPVHLYVLKVSTLAALLGAEASRSSRRATCRIAHRRGELQAASLEQVAPLSATQTPTGDRVLMALHTILPELAQVDLGRTPDVTLGEIGLGSVNLAELEAFLTETLGDAAPIAGITPELTVDALRRMVERSGGQSAAAPQPVGPRGLLPALAILTGWVWRVVTVGAQHIPEGGALIASNHGSLLDPLWLLTAVPKHLRRRCATGIWSEQLRGVSRLATAALPLIPVERDGGPAALRAAEQFLQGGGLLLWHPEGHRNRTRSVPLLPLQHGAAHLVLRSGKPLVPAAIVPASPRGIRRTVRVRFGSPIEFDRTGGELHQKRCAAVTAILTDAITGLLGAVLATEDNG